MAVAQGGVQVEGLRELARALKQLSEKALLNDLKSVNVQAAEQVIAAARGNASTALQQSAASRLKATKTAAYAAVRLGGRRGDLGAEFGAMRDAQRSNVGGNPSRSGRGWNQFEPWRGSGPGAGYFLYPAIRAEGPQVAEAYADEVEKIAAKALNKVE